MTYQRNMPSLGGCGELEDGVDEGLPEGVEQPEIAAGDHDEAQDDRGGLADLAPIGPLDAPQLVPDVAQEDYEARASAPCRRARVLGGLLGDRRIDAARGHEVALDLVGRGLVVELVLQAFSALGREGEARLGEPRLVGEAGRVVQRGKDGRAGGVDVGRRLAQPGLVDVGVVEPHVARRGVALAARATGAPGALLAPAPLLRALTISGHPRSSVTGSRGARCGDGTTCSTCAA